MVYELHEHLRSNLRHLDGDWVQKKSAYEADICHVLVMAQVRGRYWDATWNGYLLEFKKGTSIWLDLVRYSEVLLKLNKDACLDVLSLFFIPDKRKQKIERIICVETYSLIKKLKLSKEYANMLVQLNTHVPHSLNAQARLTVNDLSDLALFTVQ